MRELNFNFILVLGMFLASVICFISGFYTTLGWSFEVFLIVLSLIGMVRGRKELYYLFAFKKHVFDYRFGIVLILLLFIGSFAPYILDQFGYYEPTIEALNAAGTVTGIANIELVLGQNSVWHYLQAGVDNTMDVYLRLNGFLLLWYVLYSFERKQWNLLVFIPLFFMFIQSPSPDLAIYILCIYVINEWFFNSKKNSSILLLISVWVVLIKITAFWLPLFIGLTILWNVYQKQSKTQWYLWIFAFVLVGLSAYKSYLTSSNWLFPLSEFYVDSAWKPNSKIIQQSSEFALQKGYNFNYSYLEIQHFSWQERWVNWFSVGGFKSFLNIFIALVSLFFVYRVIKCKDKKYYLISAILVLKLVIVFYFSAQQRFMWDAVLVMILLLIQSKKWWKYCMVLASFGTIIVLYTFLFPQWISSQIPSFKLSQMMQGYDSSQWLKPTRYEVQFSENHRVGNLQFQSPIDYPFLANTPFVALSKIDVQYYQSLGIFPQWENSKIVMKPIDAQMEKEIQNYLQ